MADQFNVSRQTIQKWESGESIPVYLHIRALREYFRVSADYILFGLEESAETQQARTNNAPAQAGAL
jgi:transcriptional regulator with XRE-family HTH domain